MTLTEFITTLFEEHPLAIPMSAKHFGLHKRRVSSQLAGVISVHTYAVSSPVQREGGDES